MKKLYIFISLILCGNTDIHGQYLIIKGRVKCENPTTNSTRGAEHVIVVPGFCPERSMPTETDGKAGFFELNTGTHYKDLRDKNIKVYLISRCEGCSENDQNQFLMERKVFVDQRTANTLDNGNYYMVLKKDWKITKKCENVELYRKQQDSLLKVIQNKPPEDVEHAKGNILMGSPSLLNLLDVIVKATFLPPTEKLARDYYAFKLYKGDIQYGNTFFSNLMVYSTNVGFNFSPSRDLSEAFYSNPAAIANSNKSTNISLLTNVKNNAKIGGYHKISNKFYLAGGAIFSMQDEFRDADYRRKSLPEWIAKADSMVFKLKEYAVFISPVVKLSNKMNLGVTLKSEWQRFNIPNRLEIVSGPTPAPPAPPIPKNVGIFTDSSIVRQNFDLNISATYQVTDNIQIGVNAMNLLGNKLYSDAFYAGQKEIPMNNQMALGIGFCYNLWRFNFGSDALFTRDKLYDVSLGLNVVPFNNALLSTGYAIKQKSYSVSFRIKHFRITYIDDNKLMFNETKKPKIDLFNGRIYGGFSFDF